MLKTTLRATFLLGAFTILVGSPAASDDHAAYTRRAPDRFVYRQVHMGMQVRIVLYAETEAAARRSATAAFVEIARLDDIFSDYRRDSELSLLVGAAAGPPVAVSQELFWVLARARELARETDGAFDVTAAPITHLWRQAIADGLLPEPSQIERARRLTGYSRLVLDPGARTVTLTAEGMKLDLGAIAKGYILDRALEVLRRHDAGRALVEAGGDIVVGSAPPERSGWRIDIPHLASATAEQSSEVPSDPLELRTCELDLMDAAVSTSGDQVQFVEIDGRRHSHTVDPRTGMGLTNGTTATVVAPDGITADSLATALTIVGEEAAPRLLARYAGARAIFSLSDCTARRAIPPQRTTQQTADRSRAARRPPDSP